MPRLLGKMFVGWWVVVGGFVIQMLGGGLLFQSFGAYIVHLKEEFGWSRTILSGPYSLLQVENGLIGPLQGWLIDRLGPRVIARAGIVIFAAGFMLLSLVHSLVLFYVVFVVIAIGSTLAGWLTLTTTVVHWFHRRRATAIGLLSTGMPAGALLVPAVAWALNTAGWRATAFGSGVVILVVGLPITQMIRSAPEKYGLAPLGAEDQEATATSARPRATSGSASTDFTAGQAVRSSAFWLIGVGHLLAVVVMSSMNVHLVPHLVERLGMSLEFASTIVAVLAVFTVVGQVAGGIIGDRVDKRMLAALGMVGHALGLLALAYASSVAWALAFTVLHGLSWGVRGPIMPAIRADYFGRKAFGAILGLSSLLLMVGGVTGPLLVGALADRTGNYRLGFTILAALAGLGTVFFLAARKPRLPA